MHHLKKISPILAVLAFLVLTGTLLASLSPPSVTQNGNSFRVSMTPLDGSVRNWIYYHKAARVGDSNSVDVCVPGGGWVQFRSVSVLTEDNSNWEESSYTKWYEVPDGSCGVQSPPPASTPASTPTSSSTPTPDAEWCRMAQEHTIQGETLTKYRTLFPSAKAPSYPDIIEVWTDGDIVSVVYELDGFYTHSDGRSGEIWGVEYYSTCSYLLSRIWFVPFSWSGGDIIILMRQGASK